MTYYTRPMTHYTTIYWILTERYGLTIEEALKIVKETMHYDYKI